MVVYLVPRKINVQPLKNLLSLWPSHFLHFLTRLTRLNLDIDARTMEIHHGKHHNAYVTNLNNAVAGKPEENLSIEEICKNISKYPAPVRNNGGGHYNHNFLDDLGPNAGGKPSGALSEAIDSAFGNFDEFKAKFAAACFWDGLVQAGHG